MTKNEYEKLYDKWAQGLLTYYEFLDECVVRMDEDTKKFVLRQLIQWHADRLDKILRETPEPKEVKDVYNLFMMREHKKIADEMEDVLTAELW